MQTYPKLHTSKKSSIVSPEFGARVTEHNMYRQAPSTRQRLSSNSLKDLTGLAQKKGKKANFASVAFRWARKKGANDIHPLSIDWFDTLFSAQVSNLQELAFSLWTWPASVELTSSEKRRYSSSSGCRATTCSRAV